MKLSMCVRIRRSLGVAGFATLLATQVFSTSALAQDSAGSVLWQPSMNVFRRHAVEADVMHDYYRDVIGLQQLATIGLGEGGGVARFQAGDSELKFTRRVADRSYVPGGVRDATGLRLLSLFFPDADSLSERFAAHGLPRPDFVQAGAAGERRALVTDPDGQWLELVIVPDAPASVYAQVEVGLTVADIASSRAFYRDFVGLEELSPQHDARFDTTKYSFRHGSTLVSLRSFAADLPADTGSGGIQYVVSNVDFVNGLAQRRGVTIDQPLNDFGGVGLRTVWLDDPDGITNYFAETRASRASAAAAQGGVADARPDFSGLWFPAGFARRTPNPSPYTAAAQNLADQYEREFRTEDDPGKYCIWPGMPRAPWGAPFAVEVFQRDQDVTIYWEGYGMYRKIYMADHNPPEALLPSRMGHSIGHWEGDTLVIETTALRPYPYMNRFATSSSATIVERMRREERVVDGETKTFLIDDLVVTDPKLYTEPVLIHAEAELRPDLQLLEYTCTDTLWEQYLLERGLSLPDVDSLPEAP